jgi:hypothetical protein
LKIRGSSEHIHSIEGILLRGSRSFKSRTLEEAGWLWPSGWSSMGTGSSSLRFSAGLRVSTSSSLWGPEPVKRRCVIAKDHKRSRPHMGRVEVRRADVRLSEWTTWLIIHTHTYSIGRLTFTSRAHGTCGMPSTSGIPIGQRRGWRERRRRRWVEGWSRGHRPVEWGERGREERRPVGW